MIQKQNSPMRNQTENTFGIRYQQTRACPEIAAIVRMCHRWGRLVNYIVRVRITCCSIDSNKPTAQGRQTMLQWIILGLFSRFYTVYRCSLYTVRCTIQYFRCSFLHCTGTVVGLAYLEADQQQQCNALKSAAFIIFNGQESYGVRYGVFQLLKIVRILTHLLMKTLLNNEKLEQGLEIAERLE